MALGLAAELLGELVPHPKEYLKGAMPMAKRGPGRNRQRGEGLPVMKDG